ncbi:hypothetical protein MF271_23865 (plasmid) [Deinococcus sp. KNUC1210]|uniref:hypothetical protein n=1 Tax=Deinococcus sp. KNUC1210 TaxID=2917691 RepID=UPI001EF15041|nr:hypothetical protein [Deinococcus sp. KNUC1210]ULH18001.1 hypothetical protein MF271_23865 [Deinococcus sp. KNUC1210]
MTSPDHPTSPLSSSITVLGADRPASEHDHALLTAAQALLSQDDHFKTLTTPTLSRCEVNAGLDDTKAGYLYLRYDVPGAVPQEFWAHWGHSSRVAFKSGQISVARP